jgi:hypothetical protein
VKISSFYIYVADRYNHRIQVFAQHTSAPSNATITSIIDGNGASVQNDGSTGSNQITFQFTSPGGTSPIVFQCSIDNSAFSRCSNPLIYTNLAVGQHTAQFMATDSTAVQGPSVSFTWQVTAITPPTDSLCVSSSRTGRIITGTNGNDSLTGFQELILLMAEVEMIE